MFHLEDPAFRLEDFLGRDFLHSSNQQIVFFLEIFRRYLSWVNGGEMRPCERVMQALNYKEPYRIPIDLGTTIVNPIVRAGYKPGKITVKITADGLESKEVKISVK